MLNGRLIPIIRQLLRSTKEVLREKNIHAQLLVVKGDGTLMTEAVAKERPIETILSGPAASVIGSLALTGRKEGIVLDMGGTTTDIAHVSGGTVKIKKEGAPSDRSAESLASVPDWSGIPTSCTGVEKLYQSWRVQAIFRAGSGLFSAGK